MYTAISLLHYNHTGTVLQGLKTFMTLVENITIILLSFNVTNLRQK